MSRTGKLLWVSGNITRSGSGEEGEGGTASFPGGEVKALGRLNLDWGRDRTATPQDPLLFVCS